MTDVPFPMLSLPGQHPHVSGGRLINCYPEPLGATAGKPNAYWRVAGLSQFGSAPSGVYRGGVQVAGTFYGLFGTTVYKFTSLGGAGVALPGAIPGTGFCWFAANQNSPPDIAVVSPGVGAFIVVDPSGVANYPGGTVGSPNCVTFMSGMFVFTYGNGLTQTSDVNSTNIGALSHAAAQSKPDALYRPIPLTNGQLLLAGANTIEVWGAPINSQGYPFSYVSTIYRGIAGPSAIAGAEDGWGKGIFLVGDDNKVSTLTTYTPTPISVPDIDQLIEREPDKTKISVGVYVSRGHGMVVVQGPNWCWEYDTTLQSWHERQSYLQQFWRAYQPINVFGNWLSGDSLASNLLKIDGTVRKELTNPLKMRVETGSMGAFPRMMRVNAIELYLTKGASIATGHDPDETNAAVGITMSRDAGLTWGTPRSVPIGRQQTSLRARASIWGQADLQGVRWRFEESAGLNFAFMGADMAVDALR
jgi:hypothetical protein